tara:strand:- start:171 stop:410 length:240 start_codon:yes stop_codon:yes gene_type:complete
MEKENQIVINKTPSFTEVWREGYVEHEGKQHKFWLIVPEGVDSEGYEYEIEIRWFFQKVPREVRAMYSYIIEAYKQNTK